MNLYSKKRIKDSILHFLAGKSSSAVIGVASLVIIARNLSIEEYGALTFLLGVTAVASSVASVGMQHSYQRFAPEIQTNGSPKQFILLSGVISLINVLSAGLLAGLIFMVSGWVTSFYQNPAWIPWLREWTLVVFFLSIYQFHLVLLEALLLQKISKWLVIGFAVFRILFILYELDNGFSLHELISIELIANGIFAVLSVFVFNKKVRSIASDMTQGRETKYLKRILNFGAFNSLREMLFIFSGHATNRLVLAKFLAPVSLATYGYSQNFAQIIQRYIPSRLLRNLLKPAFMGKYARTKDHDELIFYNNIIFKINCIIIGCGMVILVLVGDELLGAVSGGRYLDAGRVLSLILGWMYVGNHILILESVANAVEENRRLFLSAVINSMFILLAIPLVYYWSIPGLIAARIMGVLSRDCYLARALEKKGYGYCFDYKGQLKILLAIGVAVLVGGLFTVESPSYARMALEAAGALFLFFCSLLVLRPFDGREMESLKSIIRK